MSTEICKLCKTAGTPWQYKDRLNGHICQSCADFLRYVPTLEPKITEIKYFCEEKYLYSDPIPEIKILLALTKEPSIF